MLRKALDKCCKIVDEVSNLIESGKTRSIGRNSTSIYNQHQTENSHVFNDSSHMTFVTHTVLTNQALLFKSINCFPTHQSMALYRKFKDEDFAAIIMESPTSIAFKESFSFGISELPSRKWHAYVLHRENLL